MSKIITYKGKLPIGVQEKIHLSTRDGLTGYKINKFQVISSQPGTDDYEYVAKIYLTDQTGNESTTIDFSDSDLIATVYHKGRHTSYETAVTDTIILDQETIMLCEKALTRIVLVILTYNCMA